MSYKFNPFTGNFDSDTGGGGSFDPNTSPVLFLEDNQARLSSIENSNFWGGNVDGIIFDSTLLQTAGNMGDAAFLMTSDNALAKTSDLYVTTGDATVAGNTGALLLYSGNSTAGASGGIQLLSGTGATNTGNIGITTSSTTGGNSGSINLTTGTASGTRGSVNINTDFINLTTPQTTILGTSDLYIKTTTDSNGGINLISGFSTGGGSSGNIEIHTGEVSGGAGASGNINIYPLDSGAIAQTGGDTVISAGGATGIGGTGGTLSLKGGWGHSNAGPVNIEGGINTNTGNGGDVNITSGGANGANSNSGNVIISSGTAAGANGDSGNISISAGLATGGGTRGNIIIDAPTISFTGNVIPTVDNTFYIGQSGGNRPYAHLTYIEMPYMDISDGTDYFGQISHDQFDSDVELVSYGNPGDFPTTYGLLLRSYKNTRYDTNDAASGTTGTMLFKTGNNSAGASGGITIETGSATTTRGSISIDAETLSLSDGNGNTILTDTNGIDVSAGASQDVYLSSWNRIQVTNDSSRLVFPSTVTGGGTTGNQTINKISGTVNFAAAATSLTVTNDKCYTNSIVFAVVRTNDSTATIKNVVPSAGSFVINLNAAATAETSVGFMVINE